MVTFSIYRRVFFLCIGAFLLLFNVCTAATYPWQSNEVGYDASLDPVMWSRAFTQDTVRKPRHFKAFAMLRNLVGDERGEQELLRLLGRPGREKHFGVGGSGDDTTRNAYNAPRHDRAFGKRGRKFTSSWFDNDDAPAIVYRKSGFKKSSPLHRRKHSNKLNARERYGVF